MTNEIGKTEVKENYELKVTPEGKYIRKAVYQPFSSIVAETRDQKIKMLNLLNGDEEALAMGEHVGATIAIQDVIFSPYEGIDEDTGEEVNGVLTYLFTIDGQIYVTSSKSVYFTLKHVFKVFGDPHWNEDEAVVAKIEKKKGKEFQYLDLKIIG